MAGKSDAHENAYLLLIFNTTTIANLADNTSTSPATTLTVALHTADPTDAGDMTSNETSYLNYVRQTVARSGAGWVVTGNSASPASDITFPTAGAGASGTITHFSIGTGVSDNLLYAGTLSPNITLAEGVQPVIQASGTTITED